MCSVLKCKVSPLTTSRLLHHGREITDDHTEAEIYVRGPSLMQGYLDNPEATATAIDDDGWLRTGDIAYKEQGKYYIVDRAKVYCGAHIM